MPINISNDLMNLKGSANKRRFLVLKMRRVITIAFEVSLSPDVFGG